MRLFTRAGYRLKRIETKKQSDGLLHLLALSAVGLCACLICLCGVSWAWFTATASSGTAVIQSSSYKLAYQVDGAAATDFTEKAEIPVPEGGQCSITLSATGTAGAAGYCSVQVGDETSYHYTKPILVGDDASAFTFTVYAAKGTKIILTPKWGSYSGDPNLSSGGIIGNTTGNTQETPMNAASTTEPATTTTSAAPINSPEENTASTPDTPADSATAQPEGVTGGEQAPAPEDSNR